MCHSCFFDAYIGGHGLPWHLKQRSQSELCADLIKVTICCSSELHHQSSFGDSIEESRAKPHTDHLSRWTPNWMPSQLSSNAQAHAREWAMESSFPKHPVQARKDMLGNQTTLNEAKRTVWRFFCARQLLCVYRHLGMSKELCGVGVNIWEMFDDNWTCIQYILFSSTLFENHVTSFLTVSLVWTRFLFYLFLVYPTSLRATYWFSDANASVNYIQQQCSWGPVLIHVHICSWQAQQRPCNFTSCASLQLHSRTFASIKLLLAQTFKAWQCHIRAEVWPSQPCSSPKSVSGFEAQVSSQVPSLNVEYQIKSKSGQLATSQQGTSPFNE